MGQWCWIDPHLTAFARTHQRIQEISRILSPVSRGQPGRLLDVIYPIVGERAAGARIWDADGNQYIDLAMGFGVQLFGHAAPFIQEALLRQIEAGLHLGPQARLAGVVAEQICDITRTDRLCFCNSGTEAVMTALRLART